MAVDVDKFREMTVTLLSPVSLFVSSLCFRAVSMASRSRCVRSGEEDEEMLHDTLLTAAYKITRAWGCTKLYPANN